MAAPSRLRIAIVQFAPRLGEVHANIATARELCRGLIPRSVDLVCFPEMSFSGYMFPDAPSIGPYLEHPRTGPTATFCAALARHLQCYVVAGFPERLSLEPEATHTGASLDPLSLSPTTTTSTPSPSSPFSGANAAILYDNTGRLRHTYHKSNLFPIDRTWARPGPGFTTLDLDLPVAPFGRTAVAICNDLNVRVDGLGGDGVWHSLERGPYELARYCLRERVRVLVLLNAWLKPEEEGEEADSENGANSDPNTDTGGRKGDGDQSASTGTGKNGQSEDGDAAHSEATGDDRDEEGLEPNWRVLNYWAMRLRPLWAEHADVDADTEGIVVPADDAHDCLVVICNRLGRERGKTFVGSSAMFHMRAGSGKPRLLHAMGEREQGVSVWTANISPT